MRENGGWVLRGRGVWNALVVRRACWKNGDARRDQAWPRGRKHRPRRESPAARRMAAEAEVPQARVAARLVSAGRNDVHVAGPPRSPGMPTLSMTLTPRNFPVALWPKNGLARVDPVSYLHVVWLASQRMIVQVADSVLEEARRLSGQTVGNAPACLKKARLPKGLPKRSVSGSHADSAQSTLIRSAVFGMTKQPMRATSRGYFALTLELFDKEILRRDADALLLGPKSGGISIRLVFIATRQPCCQQLAKHMAIQ